MIHSHSSIKGLRSQKVVKFRTFKIYNLHFKCPIAKIINQLKIRIKVISKRIWLLRTHTQWSILVNQESHEPMNKQSTSLPEQSASRELTHVDQPLELQAKVEVVAPSTPQVAPLAHTLTKQFPDFLDLVACWDLELKAV